MYVKLVNAPKKDKNASKYFLPTHCSLSHSNFAHMQAFVPHATNLHPMAAVQST